MNRPIIRDSTLREGIELPGVKLDLKTKVGIAEFLEKMNVPEIEIGMPYGLKSCIPLAKAIRSQGLKIKTSALILAHHDGWKEELQIASASTISRIEILFAASDILLRLKDYYKTSKKQLPESVEEKVSYAKKILPEVGVGFIDATRTDLVFLKKLLFAAKSGGADRAIIYDTVGMGTPEKITEIVQGIKKSFQLPLIIHCHNDFGLASANSIAGILAGASGADVVVNGLGDRGGNASFEQVVLALELLYRKKTGIRLNSIYKLAKYIEKTVGIRQSPVRPIAGEYTYLHSPVQHIYNAISKNASGFEPFKPGLVGAERKYSFSLPVDYSVALEAFYKKAGLKTCQKKTRRILSALRKKSLKRGLTEDEILQIIKNTP